MSQGTKGYIKLYRDLQDCWVWFDDVKFTKGQAWVDLLMLANHKDKKMSFKDGIITIKRGQYVTSIAKLADRWNWSFNTTKKFLNLLESDNMLTRKSDNKKTLITIVNYRVYQSDDEVKKTNLDRQTDSQTDSQIDSQADSPSANKLTVKLTPNNKEKKEKKEKEYIYIRKFEEAWKHYPRKEDRGLAYKCYMARLNDGYSEDELLQATIGYEEECKREHREKRYIKKGATFYGVNTPFVDYLNKGDEDGKSNNTTTRQYTDEELDRFEDLL